MTKTLINKTALVTGGSRGMGADTAMKLATLGAKVAITYSSSPDKAEAIVKAITSAGGDALAFKADSAKPEEIIAAISQTVKEFGGLDILVNNAGIAAGGSLDALSLEDLDRLIAINVRGVFVAAQEASKHMSFGGRIINIGSILSDHAAMSGVTAYAMTKGAVASLTRGLARDLGPKGITVNNIQPGPIDTDMNPADGPNASLMLSMIPAGRYGKGHDIANTVAFLASEEASFVNGAQITVDGGANA
jgi:3-oxoacyl-[acyl-carrier protein] reductase